MDGAVNAVGRVPLLLGTLLRSMQTGLVQFYALGMVLGGLVLLLAIDQQLSARVLAWFIGLWSSGRVTVTGILDDGHGSLAGHHDPLAARGRLAAGGVGAVGAQLTCAAVRWRRRW